MWEVYEHRSVAKGLKRLPVHILKRYEKWKDIVRTTGPEGLRLIKGFNDEALRGQGKGHRSCRLGDRYRLIYQVVSQEIIVLVVDITAHDYRRR